MTVTAGATLTLWEALAASPPVARGAAMLVARGQASSFDEACAAPLSAGALAALDELREREGPVVDAVITCPDCGALLDLPLPLDAMRAGAGAANAASAGAVQRERFVGDIAVRAPSTSDLLVALASDDAAATLQKLCVRRPVSADAPDALPDEVLSAVEDLCGAAILSVRVECIECGADITADVDIVDLLTARIADDAVAVLREVSDIASAFGWTESGILALSPLRREYYLSLARGRGVLR